MIRLLISGFLFSLCACAQQGKFSESKIDMTEIYTQAIEDFIKAANKENANVYDTLYIAKRKFGQPDDFPDIELPTRIENVQIVLITPEDGEKSQKERKTRIYINLFGWIEKQKAEFTFIVFSNGFDHMYDYNLSYKYNIKNNIYELDKLQFKGPPFGK